jgi:3-hydroxyisobutyrate dehydrogenase-like beta-hydroxyacid dehydrogenase
MKIGFLGLGHMGSQMAKRLMESGHELHVYNRTASAADELIKRGARFAAHPMEIGDVEVYITMLADDSALESVLFGEKGLFQSMLAGSTHLSMSTISPALAERLEKDHQSKGCAFVGAPVFGRPEAAEAGKLFVMAGGTAPDVQKCSAVFEALSQKVFHVSEKPSLAHLTKVLGNFMLLSSIQILSESLAIANKSGLDQKIFLEAMTGSLFSAPFYKGYGTMMIDKLYDKKVAFKLPLALKDIRLAQQAAESINSPMPSASLVHDQIITAIARGMKDMDLSALGKLASDNAGL